MLTTRDARGWLKTGIGGTQNGAQWLLNSIDFQAQTSGLVLEKTTSMAFSPGSIISCSFAYNNLLHTFLVWEILLALPLSVSLQNPLVSVFYRRMAVNITESLMCGTHRQCVGRKLVFQPLMGEIFGNAWILNSKK